MPPPRSMVTLRTQATKKGHQTSCIPQFPATAKPIAESRDLLRREARQRPSGFREGQRQNAREQASTFGRQGDREAAAVALALLYLSLEVTRLYRGEMLTAGSATDAEQYTYSVVWLAYGVALHVFSEVPIFSDALALQLAEKFESAYLSKCPNLPAN